MAGVLRRLDHLDYLSAELEIARSALQAGESLRPPHIDDAAAVFDNEEHLAFVDAAEHVALGFDIAPHIIVSAKTDLVVLDALALHPFDGLTTVPLVSAGAENDINPGVVKDIAEPYDGVCSFVVRHSFEKRIPVFWMRADVVFTRGDVGESAVDIENSDLIHILRITAANVTKLYYALPFTSGALFNAVRGRY
jgi:hypothetical protein